MSTPNPTPLRVRRQSWTDAEFDRLEQTSQPGKKPGCLWHQIRILTFRLLIGAFACLCFYTAHVLFCTWKATSFLDLSEPEIDHLVGLPYLAYESSEQVLHLAATTRSTYNDTAAEECIHRLTRLVPQSASLTLAWHDNIMTVLDAIDDGDFHTATTTIGSVLASLSNLEPSTSAALVDCYTFFDSLDPDLCNDHIARYRIASRPMRKALDTIRRARSLWHGALGWSRSAGAIDRFLWRLVGFRASLLPKARVVESLVEACKIAYGARVREWLEQEQRRIQERNRSRSYTWSRWLWAGKGG